MSSEWMKVMLEEISRKKAEAEQARMEEQARADERARSRNKPASSNKDAAMIPLKDDSPSTLKLERRGVPLW